MDANQRNNRKSQTTNPRRFREETWQEDFPNIKQDIDISRTSEPQTYSINPHFHKDQEEKIPEEEIYCKFEHISIEIKNCDSAKWNTAAAKECYPGILSKFHQNVGIASYLKTTGTKTLLECNYDDVWGNGIPLSNPKCINPAEYKHQGILGSMLEQVRDHLLNSADTVPAFATCPSPCKVYLYRLHA